MILNSYFYDFHLHTDLTEIQQFSDAFCTAHQEDKAPYPRLLVGRKGRHQDRVLKPGGTKPPGVIDFDPYRGGGKKKWKKEVENVHKEREMMREIPKEIVVTIKRGKDGEIDNKRAMRGADRYTRIPYRHAYIQVDIHRHTHTHTHTHKQTFKQTNKQTKHTEIDTNRHRQTRT